MYTVEPPIVDPPRKGHCMLDLSIKVIAQGPKNYSPYNIENLREEDNLSIKKKNSWIYIVPKVSIIRRFHSQAPDSGCG